jgi:hypothetical protein
MLIAKAGLVTTLVTALSVIGTPALAERMTGGKTTIRSNKGQPNSIPISTSNNTSQAESISKDKSQSYSSWKEGTFTDPMLQGSTWSTIKLEKNTGKLREIEFLWKNRKAVGVLGGVSLDSDNQISNFVIGAIFPNDAQFVVRSYTLKDQLLHHNAYVGTGQQYVLADINSTTTNISYLMPVSANNGNTLVFSFTYGKSDLPSRISIKGGNAGGSTTIIIDTKPQNEYLVAGIHAPQHMLKNKVLDGKTGLVWYMDHEVQVGYYKQTLSQDGIYDPFYGKDPTGVLNVNNLGIRSQVGNNFSLNLFTEVGPAYLFKVDAAHTGSVSVGMFYDGVIPIGTISGGTSNSTSKGYTWLLSGRVIYGFNARIAMTF